MNRRKFFKWLGVGAVGVAVAPSTLVAAEPVCVATPIPPTEIKTASMDWGCECAGRSFWEGQCEWCERQPKTQSIQGYVDYTSFSAMATAAAIDDIVSNAAKELGEAAGRDISALHAQVFA